MQAIFMVTKKSLLIPDSDSNSKYRLMQKIDFRVLGKSPFLFHQLWNMETQEALPVDGGLHKFPADVHSRSYLGWFRNNVGHLKFKNGVGT